MVNRVQIDVFSKEQKCSSPEIVNVYTRSYDCDHYMGKYTQEYTYTHMRVHVFMCDQPL